MDYGTLGVKAVVFETVNTGVAVFTLKDGLVAKMTLKNLFCK